MNDRLRTKKLRVPGVAETRFATSRPQEDPENEKVLAKYPNPDLLIVDREWRPRGATCIRRAARWAASCGRWSHECWRPAWRRLAVDAAAVGGLGNGHLEADVVPKDVGDLSGRVAEGYPSPSATSNSEAGDSACPAGVRNDQSSGPHLSCRCTTGDAHWIDPPQRLALRRWQIGQRRRTIPVEGGPAGLGLADHRR